MGPDGTASKARTLNGSTYPRTVKAGIGPPSRQSVGVCLGDVVARSGQAANHPLPDIRRPVAAHHKQPLATGTRESKGTSRTQLYQRTNSRAAMSKAVQIDDGTWHHSHQVDEIGDSGKLTVAALMNRATL